MNWNQCEPNVCFTFISAYCASQQNQNQNQNKKKRTETLRHTKQTYYTMESSFVRNVWPTDRWWILDFLIIKMNMNTVLHSVRFTFITMIRFFQYWIIIDPNGHGVWSYFLLHSPIVSKSILTISLQTLWLCLRFYLLGWNVHCALCTLFHGMRLHGIQTAIVLGSVLL